MRLNLAGTAPLPVVLIRDPRTQALNIFGDPTQGTPEAETVELFDGRPLEREDPSGAQREVWSLDHRPETGPHTYDLCLVVDARRDRYRLVVTENLNDPLPDVITVVPLERETTSG